MRVRVFACAPFVPLCGLAGLHSAQHPSESLPASYGPGAGMRVRVFACAPFVPLCWLRSDPCKLRSALRPSESLPVSYGPGAGLRT